MFTSQLRGGWVPSDISTVGACVAQVIFVGSVSGPGEPDARVFA